MHPALADHTNPGCIDFAERLLNCHADNKWAKFFGKCNALSEALNKCLGEEFAVRRKKQQIEARERHARVKAKWDELKEDNRQQEEFERLLREKEAKKE